MNQATAALDARSLIDHRLQAECDKNVQLIKELAERRHQLDSMRVQQQKATSAST